LNQTGNGLSTRRSGILLHITSLPGSLGNGDLGNEAYRFVDFLVETGVSVWQMLPLGPTHLDGSPYQCLSVHAGNPLLISLDWLVDRGWLSQFNSTDALALPREYRFSRLQEAYQLFKRNAKSTDRTEFEEFNHTQADWLDSYACYMALRKDNNCKSWEHWPESVRDRHPNAINDARLRLADEIEAAKFEQYIFFKQWQELKTYANQRGVLLFGDMPIFVSGDSDTVWANREYFYIREDGKPEVVAGVPPDYFSETGQRWGNPHYNWKRLQLDGFSWWIRRVRTQLQLFDWIRIDHFRGLESYWEIPAEEPTAISGRWVKAPGDAMLRAIYANFGALPLIAEDLGIITPEVEELRDKFNLPGMKILHFAFDGGASNPYLPHNHSVNSVVYTGTHDNDTTLSWFEFLPEQQKSYLYEYLGNPQQQMPWVLIQVAMASVARLAVIPMQDILELGTGERMNTPGTTEGNWQWRFEWNQLTDDRKNRLAYLIRLYDRKS